MLSKEKNDTAVPGCVASRRIGHVEGEWCWSTFLDAMGEQALSPSQSHQPVGRCQAHYHQQHHYDPAYKRDHLQENEHVCNKATSSLFKRYHVSRVSWGRDEERLSLEET